MKQKMGFWAGLLLAALGTAIGVVGAWYGFSSTPYDGAELGRFCGFMGLLVGCYWAGIGAYAGYWLKRGASRFSA
ncbi:MAG: hypothetical protein VX447_02870 [Pseudomonadota bacterium]|uniref:hypothetical protein n=1 Tax=Gallaecimonas pentaromativorans TaxID=584787 RepID=UPI00067EE644|nr:hypothetical protein [Gallaecimonas pentaromativorans]MED5523687.1 hypothetical protein [Pseudomonadota bacterium]